MFLCGLILARVQQGSFSPLPSLTLTHCQLLKVSTALTIPAAGNVDFLVLIISARTEYLFSVIKVKLV